MNGAMNTGSVNSLVTIWWWEPIVIVLSQVRSRQLLYWTHVLMTKLTCSCFYGSRDCFIFLQDMCQSLWTDQPPDMPHLGRGQQNFYLSTELIRTSTWEMSALLIHTCLKSYRFLGHMSFEMRFSDINLFLVAKAICCIINHASILCNDIVVV